MSRVKVVAHISGSSIPIIRSKLQSYFDAKGISPVALSIKRLGSTGSVQVSGIFTASVKTGGIKTVLSKCGRVSYFARLGGKSATKLGRRTVTRKSKRSTRKTKKTRKSKRSTRKTKKTRKSKRGSRR